MQIITLAFDGERPTITTQGFSGGACRTETEELKRALGLTERQEVPTREGLTTVARKTEVSHGR